MSAAIVRPIPGEVANVLVVIDTAETLGVAIDFLVWARGVGWTNAAILAAIGRPAPDGVEPEASTVIAALVAAWSRLERRSA